MRRFTVFLVCATVAALLYVSMEIEAVKIGYAIHKQDEIKVQLLDRSRALKYNIARLEAPHNLERRLMAQKILLTPPKEWQMLILANSQKVAPHVQGVNSLRQPPYFLKFFVGTAQAEAKDTR